MTSQPREPAVLVIPRHDHLAPAAWAAAQRRPGLRVGFVRMAGDAVLGPLPRDVAELEGRGLLDGHEATVAAAAARWDAAICEPSPDAAHAALSLGLSTLISPLLSGAGSEADKRGLSPQTAELLAALPASVRVPVPEIDVAGWPTGEHGPSRAELPSALDALHDTCGDRHDVTVEPVDLAGYAESGLPTLTADRAIDEDPLFFAAPLAAGRALAEAAGRGAQGDG